MEAKKVGRNEPCSCGSGKKYKNCCLNKAQEVRKTYTLSGKRKFKAKVIHGSLPLPPSTASAEKSPEEMAKSLRFRMAQHDYRSEEKSSEKRIQQPDLKAPQKSPKPSFSPGEEYHSPSENFQVDQK